MRKVKSFRFYKILVLAPFLLSFLYVKFLVSVCKMLFVVFAGNFLTVTKFLKAELFLEEI